MANRYPGTLSRYIQLLKHKENAVLFVRIPNLLNKVRNDYIKSFPKWITKIRKNGYNGTLTSSIYICHHDFQEPIKSIVKPDIVQNLKQYYPTLTPVCMFIVLEKGETKFIDSDVIRSRLFLRNIHKVVKYTN